MAAPAGAVEVVTFGKQKPRCAIHIFNVPRQINLDVAKSFVQQYGRILSMTPLDAQTDTESAWSIRVNFMTQAGGAAAVTALNKSKPWETMPHLEVPADAQPLRAVRLQDESRAPYERRYNGLNLLGSTEVIHSLNAFMGFIGWSNTIDVVEVHAHCAKKGAAALAKAQAVVQQADGAAETSLKAEIAAVRAMIEAAAKSAAASSAPEASAVPQVQTATMAPEVGAAAAAHERLTSAQDIVMDNGTSALLQQQIAAHLVGQGRATSAAGPALDTSAVSSSCGSRTKDGHMSDEQLLALTRRDTFMCIGQTVAEELGVEVVPSYGGTAGPGAGAGGPVDWDLGLDFLDSGPAPQAGAGASYPQHQPSAFGMDDMDDMVLAGPAAGLGLALDGFGLGQLAGVDGGSSAGPVVGFPTNFDPSAYNDENMGETQALKDPKHLARQQALSDGMRKTLHVPDMSGLAHAERMKPVRVPKIGLQEYMGKRQLEYPSQRGILEQAQRQHAVLTSKTKDGRTVPLHSLPGHTTVKPPCVFVRQTITVHNPDGSMVKSIAAAGCSCRHRDDGLSGCTYVHEPAPADEGVGADGQAGAGASHSTHGASARAAPQDVDSSAQPRPQLSGAVARVSAHPPSALAMDDLAPLSQQLTQPDPAMVMAGPSAMMAGAGVGAGARPRAAVTGSAAISGAFGTAGSMPVRGPAGPVSGQAGAGTGTLGGAQASSGGAAGAGSSSSRGRRSSAGKANRHGKRSLLRTKQWTAESVLAGWPVTTVAAEALRYAANGLELLVPKAEAAHGTARVQSARPRAAAAATAGHSVALSSADVMLA